ncbi:MAG: hypothetical protein KIT25_14890 [Enhydrobacter sp.]|nr:MAG: hypothetical protein KIT25_14890 [Enhydrobacter sp.]
MIAISRRSAARYLAGAALAAPLLPALATPALAAGDLGNLYVAKRFENFKRGSIHSLDPKTRGLVVIWPDQGRVKMKAADMVVKSSTLFLGGNGYNELQVGQTVDIHWYDYVDFLVAKTSPQVTARADAMVKENAYIEGLPGSKSQIRLFKMTGMVTKTEPAAGFVYIVNASSGEPDAPAPDSGEVIRLPQIVSDEGKAALATLKPGDNLTAVYSVQTAFKIAIIR